MALSAFEYEPLHIEGERSELPDALSRWAVFTGSESSQGHPAQRTSVPRQIESRLSVVTVRPLQQEDFVWPTYDEIRAIQQSHPQERGTALSFDEERGISVVDGKIWVPKEAHELEVRLMVIAHAEPPVDSGAYELLGVIDVYSHSVQMYPCRSVGAEEALAALLHWFGTFGVPKFLVSDQGTYFKNVLLETLARRLQFQHPLARLVIQLRMVLSSGRTGWPLLLPGSAK